MWWPVKPFKTVTNPIYVWILDKRNLNLIISLPKIAWDSNTHLKKYGVIIVQNVTQCTFTSKFC